MSSIDDLGALVARHVPGVGIHRTALPNVSLALALAPTMPMPTLYKPSVCIVASGSKRVELGKTGYLYDAATFLAVSVDLPVTGAVVDASSNRPFLCLRLDIDVGVLRELVLDGHGAPPAGGTPVGLMRGRTTPELVDASVRLLRLLDAPADAAPLAPLAEREILYRLLTGPTAGMMRHIASVDSHLSQISRAIAWLRDHYRDVFTVEDLARKIGMSPSAFHLHFKAVTTMSPLQFRNALRLQSARRMMVAEGRDAASAGFEVGFQSPSQFSRDYARFFGASPLRDARRLREDPELWVASQP
ncbi:AraC family transcriptional regulator [Lichenifustis flavocetrariae]|uniref:AraC family transcriptional regulator n=1 Tax=Lichenifustis flavocetrariae TaxID=2949735 RepID=A0AA41YZE4_9HYPH|nr:AraC family transcriptional regulator [Lichenifustis flavocetrariae]MCW6510042.1 AraC family transcriptional regulator [Lichenifustis flavocetrariae]